MLLNYKSIIAAIISILLATTYIYIQRIQIQRDHALLRVSQLTREIELQNSAIDKWKKESIDYQNKIKTIKRKEDDELNKRNLEIESLNNEKISHKCEEAIQWGVQKSKEL